MSKREKRLVRNAARALCKLAGYRDKHGTPAAASVALDDMAVSGVLWGLPVKDAEELAQRLLARGIHPTVVRRVFAAESERIQ